MKEGRYMSAAERLAEYCRIDTQSDPASGTHPSSEKEFNLAKVLVKQLQELGLKDAELDEHCYIYAHLDSNLDHEAKTVGFIAHMDTAPDFSGSDVNPQIIENFDGNDIVLKNGRVTKMADFPAMKNLKGKTLMVTDGNTLLGADDKAGIVSIMEALAYWKEHPEERHGRIAVSFTPDEEIGEGPMFFDVKRLGADFAYTMDGDAVNVMSDETFNAVSAIVDIEGFSIHPGEAKNRMINAAAVGCEFQAGLPEALTPEHTEGREGFIHLTGFNGRTESAHLGYILRDHDAGKIEDKKKLMEALAAYLNVKYGEGTVKISFTESYRNMKEVLSGHPEVSGTARDAIEALGMTPENVPVRGGTDGSQISFMGLPCPNLGTGGGNFHGPYEYCVLEELDMASRVIRKIAELTAERR